MKENLRLIVVEDHEITRIGLKVGLVRSGGLDVVAEVDNGRDAVTMCLELKPDVVLMDIGLPVKSGIQASREIKAACESIRILMLTSHDADEDIRDAFAAGADGYCLKDVPTHALALAVKSVASGALWLDPRIARSVLDLCAAESQHRPSRSTQAPKNFLREPSDELTAREREVLELVAKGLTNSEIGEKLFVSPQTVKTHVRHIMDKLSVSDRTQAAVKAVQRGLV
jgi:DNA-binding NarL/FixJ family response regulator